VPHKGDNVSFLLISMEISGYRITMGHIAPFPIREVHLFLASGIIERGIVGLHKG